MKRIAYYKVVEVMDNYRIPILVGLRRTGKTTILKQIQNENKDNSLFIRFDSLEMRRLNTIQIKNIIKEHIAHGIDVFLLDEIQVRKDWGILIKDLFDDYVTDKKIKVVVTGSSSLTFENTDTGVDRTQKVLISTMDFNEYTEITGKEKTYKEFEDFLGSGAFPGYADGKHTFEELMALTLEPILNDDIPSQYKVNPDNIIRLLWELSSLTNGEFNKTRSSKNTGIAINQINTYLDILEKTQIIKRVYKVDVFGSVGRYPSYKVYINPHFHLWILNKPFSKLEGKQIGHIIESYWLFASTQIGGYYKKFYYLKDSSGSEIDFVSLNPSGTPTFKTLHEFKYSLSPSTNDFFKTTPSLNKVIWSKKETGKIGIIKYENIIEFSNPYKL